MTPLQKLLKNVGALAKLILPRALKTCPKSNKSPNPVTLTTYLFPPKSLQKNFAKIYIILGCIRINLTLSTGHLWSTSCEAVTAVPIVKLLGKVCP